MHIIKLTMHTDYALRVLLQAASAPGTRLSIAQVAAQHGISRNHLMKVVNQLANIGLIETVRGPGGGFSLARDPAAITLGEVVRQTEPNMQAADCGACMFRTGCGLTPILGSAMDAFLDVLDRRTLADALKDSALDFVHPAPATLATAAAETS